MATILDTTRCSDGFDVRCLLENGTRQTFHFVREPEDLKKTIDALEVSTLAADAAEKAATVVMAKQQEESDSLVRMLQTAPDVLAAKVAKRLADLKKVPTEAQVKAAMQEETAAILGGLG